MSEITFRKNKKYTAEQKQEIIAYAEEHGLTSVKEKFNAWPETVRYWMDANLRKHIKTQQAERSLTKVKSEREVQRDIAYRKSRQESGISPAAYRIWLASLTPEERKLRRQNSKQHRLDNIDHYKQKSHDRYIKSKPLLRKKYKEDPIYRLHCNIREHIRQAIKYGNVAKSHPSIVYLGCSIEEFRAYIATKFLPGMTWDNHGRGDNCWHLDHIKPICMLKNVEDTELKEFCHYTNYQPLWEQDNLTKNALYEGIDQRGVDAL